VRFRRIGFSLLFILSAIIIAFGIIAYKAGVIIRYDSDRTFHSPIFNSDGSEVYFLSRSASGVSWGPGIEFFTPPAKVFFLGDRFSLMALDIATKKTRTLCTWRSPMKRGPVRNTGAGFSASRDRADAKRRRIYFKIGLDVRRDKPNTRLNEWLTGYYDIDGRRAVETKSGSSRTRSLTNGRRISSQETTR